MYDLVIRNCEVFDGETFLEGKKDICVSDGRITSVEDAGVSVEGKRTFDASGLLVTPGLIDVHAHIFPFASIGTDPSSAMIPFGVTAAVDAGSSGAHTFEISESAARLRIQYRCFLNVCSSGLYSMRSFPEDISPEHYDVKEIKRLFGEYPERLCGLKIRMGRECTRGSGTYPLEKTLELADDLGVRVCVHVSDPEMPAGEIAALLRPGDIFTHTYQGRGNGILDKEGKIDPMIASARDRGVIFDVGDARVHLSLDVFKTALAQGFSPDTIGSDITDAGEFVDGAFALPYVVSKTVSLGLPAETALRAVTSKAAGMFGFDGGRIKPGARADIAAFRKKAENRQLCDSFGKTVAASCFLLPRITVISGRIVWRSLDD